MPNLYNHQPPFPVYLTSLPPLQVTVNSDRYANNFRLKTLLAITFGNNMKINKPTAPLVTGNTKYTAKPYLKSIYPAPPYTTNKPTPPAI